MFSRLDVFGVRAPQLQTELPGLQGQSERAPRLLGVLAIAVALVASVSACADWWMKQTAWHETVTVDKNSAQQRFTLDITFPHLHCADMELWKKDSCHIRRGTTVVEESVVTKYNIEDEVETPYEDPPKGLCLSCHEATPLENAQSEDQSPVCCNTCRDLVVAFFDRGMLDGRDFTQYPQCKPKGCRFKASILYADPTGSLFSKPTMRGNTKWARPEVLLAEKWDPSHIIHSATLSPVIHAYSEPTPLHVQNMGKLRTHGIDEISYTAFVMPTSVHKANATEFHLTNTNRVDKVARHCISPGAPTFQCLPGFEFKQETLPFGRQRYQKPTPSHSLISQLLITFGSILAFFDFVAALLRRLTSTKIDAQTVRRLQNPVEQLRRLSNPIEDLTKTTNLLSRWPGDAMPLSGLSGTTVCSDDFSPGNSALTERLSSMSDV